MKESVFRLILAIAVLCAGVIATLRAQQGTLTPAEREQRLQTEKELESAAIIERKVMVPMRDGVRLATDIYRPKNASGKGRSFGCAHHTILISGMCATECRPT